MITGSFKTRDVLPNTIWMIMGISITIMAYNLDIGSFQNPGPGMYPFLLGILLFSISLTVLVYNLRNMGLFKKKEEAIWADVEFGKIAGTIAILLGYGLLLERLGFSVTTFFSLFFLFKIIGVEKLSRALVWSILIVISAYLLFIVALKVYMPSFPWEDLMNILH